MVMFSMKIQAGVISPLYLVLAVIAVIVLYVIVLKILSKLNKDYLLKD